MPKALVLTHIAFCVFFSSLAINSLDSVGYCILDFLVPLPLGIIDWSVSVAYTVKPA